MNVLQSICGTVATMYHKDILLTSLLLLFGAAMATANSQSQAFSRCYQFTWLGPRYNNLSTFLNATCADATRLANGIPCQMPLVVSYDGTWPDVHYIWDNYAQQAMCVLADNDVCAQYTYYFNGVVDNSTYMCTRAVDTEGHAITSGCYHQANGSFSTRVCFCRSIPGGIPCNNGVINSVMSTYIIVSVIVLLINNNFIIY